MTLIPRLVGRDRLEAGNSLVQGTMQLGSLTGAAPAGFLINAFGVAMAFAVGGSLVDLNTGIMFAASGSLILVTGLYLAANRVIRTLD